MELLPFINPIILDIECLGGMDITYEYDLALNIPILFYIPFVVLTYVIHLLVLF
jgi:hypothetical protein